MKHGDGIFVPVYILQLISIYIIKQFCATSATNIMTVFKQISQIRNNNFTGLNIFMVSQTFHTIKSMFCY